MLQTKASYLAHALPRHDAPRPSIRMLWSSSLFFCPCGAVVESVREIGVHRRGGRDSQTGIPGTMCIVARIQGFVNPGVFFMLWVWSRLR